MLKQGSLLDMPTRMVTVSHFLLTNCTKCDSCFNFRCCAWVANLKVLLLLFWGCRQQSKTVETEDVNLICDFKLLYVYLCIIYSTHFFLLVVMQKGLSTMKLPVDKKIPSTGRVGELFWRGDMHSLIVDLDPSLAEFEISCGIVYRVEFLMQF